MNVVSATAKRLPILLTPRPTYCGSADDPDDVAVARHLHCGHYHVCLRTAAALDWPGFTCNRCSAYQPATATRTFHELRPLLELLAAILEVAELPEQP